MTVNLRDGFAAVMADQADPSLANLTIDVLRQLLALHMHVHRHSYCDRDGFFEGTRFPRSAIPLRQFVAERFGLYGHRLSRFIRSLTKSSLFESNGERNENRRYRLAATARLDLLLEQYQAFAAESTERSLPVFTPLDRGQVAKILGVSADLFRCPIHASGDAQHLPQSVLRHELARRLASELLATPVGSGHVLADDLELTSLVAELMTEQS